MDAIYPVNISDIIHCEADKNYTTVYLVNRKNVIVSRSLKEFDDDLCPSGFIRVHQSHIVNPAYISKYVKGDGGYLVMSDGIEIPVSIRKKEALMFYFERKGQ